MSEEYGPRVLENRVLRRILGPKMDEVTGEWRRLHMEQVYDLHTSPNIIQVMKLKRMRWVGHMVHMGERIVVCRVLVGKSEGKRPRGRPRCRWEVILKWIFNKLDGEA